MPSGAEEVLNGAESGSVDLNIDDVLAGLNDDLDEATAFASDDLQIPDIPDDATEDFSVESFMPTPDAIESDVSASVEKLDAAVDNDEDVFAYLDSDETLASVSEEAAVEFVPDDVSVPDVTPEAAPEISELLEVVDTGVTDDLADNDAVEMDALLDDILDAPEEATEELVESLEVESDDVEDIFDDMAEEPEGYKSAEQSDLELVKSLMAELADDPSSYTPAEVDALLDEGLLEADLDVADIALDEVAADDLVEDILEDDLSVEDMILPESVETAELAPDLLDTPTDGEEDILGDILDMSIEDELQDQPDDFDLGDLASLDDVAAAEQENILENILEDAAPLGAGEADFEIDQQLNEVPTLAEIAAAAEADAMSVETSALGAAGAAAGVGLAALGAKAAANSDDNIQSTADNAPAVEDTLREINPLPTQETSMPVKAVKTDTIIDEVTESATAGAFAELNQVVEDKAVFNERGPRIGDLVQDALRPMLKEWLDANLKGIVERAVTKEVKRISKGN